MSALDDLEAVLRAEGGLIANALLDAPAGAPLPPGPRDAEVGLVLEAVREGWLLHAGRPRVVGDADPDLALLAGDRLYALGLERLAALGDLEAVAALADLISECARSHAEERPEIADTAWAKGVRAVHRQPGASGAPPGTARAYSSGR